MAAAWGESFLVVLKTHYSAETGTVAESSRPCLATFRRKFYVIKCYDFDGQKEPHGVGFPLSPGRSTISSSPLFCWQILTFLAYSRALLEYGQGFQRLMTKTPVPYARKTFKHFVCAKPHQNPNILSNSGAFFGTIAQDCARRLLYPDVR